MDKQLGICDICGEPVYDSYDHGGYIRICGTYAHADCAENYGKENTEE